MVDWNAFQEILPDHLASVDGTPDLHVLPESLNSKDQSNCSPCPEVHFVGILGSGMRSLAELMHQEGWKISGSDLQAGSPDGLLAGKIPTIQGHHAKNVPHDAKLIIRSAAAPDTNPEIVEAHRLGIPVVSYFEMLGRMMRTKKGIGVAGSHGKSTTTAMLGHIFETAGVDPTVIGGGVPLGRPTGGRGGEGPLMVAEACEYRSHFLHLPCRDAILLGIEHDHFDSFQSLGDLEMAFAQFVRSIPKEGLLIARHTCRSTNRVLNAALCHVETFGMNHQADWSGHLISEHEGRYTIEIKHRQASFCRLTLRVPGRHNIFNATAAAAMAWHQGVSPVTIVRALESFSGIQRRLEYVGKRDRVILLDDYAHHPTEVSATLTAVRRMYPDRKVCCIFQPHQALRTARLLDEFAKSLQNVDQLIIADIFHARQEKILTGITAADLAARTRRTGLPVADFHEIDQIAERWSDLVEPGMILITMGAGDIRRVTDGILNGFRVYRAAG